MGSRLALDPHGRTVAIVTTPSLWLRVGDRFVVVDLFELGFTRPGRPPSARERDVTSRHFYDSNSAKRQRADVPDDELDEQAALEACRLEQQRTPPDLVNVAA